MKRAMRYSSRNVIFKAISFGILPLIIGVYLVYIQAEHELESESARAAYDAANRISVMVDDAAMASDAILNLVDTPCDQAEVGLRKLVLSFRFVRVASIVQNNRIYCSSLYSDAYNRLVIPEDNSRGILSLINGGVTDTKIPVLVYMKSVGSSSALVGIDGRIIGDVLDQFDGVGNLTVRIGDYWMSIDGIVKEISIEMVPVAKKIIYNEKYGFSVYAGYPPGFVWKVTFNKYGSIVALLCVLGLFAGVGIYWMLGRLLAPGIELQRALSKNEFIPYYQPIVTAHDHSIAGVEVLMRWQHPSEGLISPDIFIPLAERSGLIIPMTKAMMTTVASDLKGVCPHFRDFHIGFNISSKHFENFDLVKDCEDFLSTFETGSVQLVLELTERELTIPTATTDALVSKLHAIGIGIAMDDFGTGHSSLSYLQKFQFDFVKIDKSFVSMIGSDALSVHILDSTIELALKLDLQLVAEGVETEEQSHYLAACGVDYLQGYLFAKPMAVQDLVALIQNVSVKLV